MGREADCSVRHGGRVSSGHALLETDELIFRGDFRLAIPLREVTSAQTQGGILRLVYGDQSTEFELGEQAAPWAERILHPPTLLDRLDVKPDSRVAILGIEDEEFWRQLKGRTQLISRGKPGTDQDLILVLADDRDALRQLDGLEAAIKRKGAIWVVAPKGGQEIREIDVLEAGRRLGLKDVKVARFSETHTAHKFVIPVARR